MTFSLDLCEFILLAQLFRCCASDLNGRSLGREIAANYESHKLYLNQIGITKERLEISVGLKQRPLTNVEIAAKNTVEIYAKSSSEASAYKYAEILARQKMDAAG
jgi:hypothetical protein